MSAESNKSLSIVDAGSGLPQSQTGASANFAGTVHQTRTAIEELRARSSSRLNAAVRRRLARAEALRLEPEQDPKRDSNRNEPLDQTPLPDELEHELQQYFDRTRRQELVRPTGERSDPALTPAAIADEIRDTVVDGVVNEILQQWDQQVNGVNPLRQEITERLIQRIMEQLRSQR